MVVSVAWSCTSSCLQFLNNSAFGHACFFKVTLLSDKAPLLPCWCGKHCNAVKEAYALFSLSSTPFGRCSLCKGFILPVSKRSHLFRHSITLPRFCAKKPHLRALNTNVCSYCISSPNPLSLGLASCYLRKRYKYLIFWYFLRGFSLQRRKHQKSRKINKNICLLFYPYLQAPPPLRGLIATVAFLCPKGAFYIPFIYLFYSI